MSSIVIAQLACLLLLGVLAVEKLFFAVTCAADGYEDDLGFHWENPNQAAFIATLIVAPL